MSATPQRADVLAMLAGFRDRRPEDVPEHIDSLELAWLLHQLERQYGFVEVDDDVLDRMETVSGVLDVLRERGLEPSGG